MREEQMRADRERAGADQRTEANQQVLHLVAEFLELAQVVYGNSTVIRPTAIVAAKLTQCMTSSARLD